MSEPQRVECEALAREPFGFTWGETDGTLWLRNDDGEYKQVHPAFEDQLFDLARDSVEPAALEPAVERTLSLLATEGYLRPGEQPRRVAGRSPIRLWPRVVAFAGLATGVMAFVARNWSGVFDGLAAVSTDPVTALLVGLVVIVGIGLHEAGHYLASRPHVQPTIRVGTLNGVLPAIITRTDDAWCCPRSVRCWISLAGPFVDVGLAAVFASLALSIADGGPLTLLAALFLARALFVLNPLIEGDGYWLLVDATGAHNLRTRGFDALRAREPSWSAAYAVASVGFTILIAVVLLSLVVRLLGVLTPI